MPFSIASLLLLLAAAQPDDMAAPPWQGQMQCSVTWTDPDDAERQWVFSVTSDTTNIDLALSDRARPGDPKPLANGETRDLVPRKAKLEIIGFGGGEIEVTSYPMAEGRMWHDIGLGHVENLDKFPAVFTMKLTLGDTPARALEMRDFDRARTYLKRCIER